jgi:hypothetical protein
VLEQAASVSAIRAAEVSRIMFFPEAAIKMAA